MANPIREYNIQPIASGKRPLISKPGNIADTNQNKNRLMTKLNNPSVTMVIGRVNTSKTGLISVFTTANIRAAITAVINESTTNPSIIWVIANRAKAFKINFTRTFITVLKYYPKAAEYSIHN